MTLRLRSKWQQGDGTSAVHRDIMVDKLGMICKSSVGEKFEDDESLLDTKPTFTTG
jgi:hypothetical protein